MNRAMRLLSAGLSVALASHALAQTLMAPSAPSTVVVADPKDVASADAIIAALYDANTVMVDRKRDADRFRSLFVPGARLIPTGRPPSGNANIRVQTPDEYISGAMRGPPRGGFSEREISRTSDAFSNIVQVFSTYESRRNTTDQNPTRGINSIQLFNDGTRWWVVTVYWAGERPDTPIPPRYLGKPPG
jgi:hypothetical protein